MRKFKTFIDTMNIIREKCKMGKSKITELYSKKHGTEGKLGTLKFKVHDSSLDIHIMDGG